MYERGGGGICVLFVSLCVFVMYCVVYMYEVERGGRERAGTCECMCVCVCQRERGRERE